MSVPTTLASKLIPFALSSDDVTYKNVVCKKAWDLNIDLPLTQEESDCSVHTAVGTPKWAFNFEIILNTTPDSNQYSADAVATFANNGTRIFVKVTYTGYYRQGAGYITNWKESAPVNGLVTCTGTFTGDGTLDLTA